MPAAPDTRDFKALDASGLGHLIAALGEPTFRTGQILRWVYQRDATSYDQMTDLPRALRESLEVQAPLTTPELVTRQLSASDGTRKYLWRLADGVTVESVGLPDGDRLTVCFSTQAGCAMGCAFCATGRGGLARSLTTGEMVDQVRLVSRDFDRRVTNAVAMGQGEPFANYEPTLGALRLMNSPDGLHIGARHLTVSTCGLLPGIQRLANEPEQFTLAISLHSAVQETRDRLMPGVAGMSLAALRQTVISYSRRTGRRPTFEYALIEGVNDGEGELDALVEFCRGTLCHVNLIPANPVTGSQYGRVRQERLAVFKRALLAAGVETSIRVERGTDIDAACGQLSQKNAALES
ncbi:MAG: 23S rRNA (adenine(2503)-C(2))-methyltransferase RlmN [Coriobacteriia bacterium]